MNNPVLTMHSRPLIAIGHGCVAYIEQSEGGPVAMRSMKLASYPDPEEYPTNESPEARITTIDIPEEILDTISQFWLRLNLGAMIILTTTKELHMFRFV